MPTTVTKTIGSTGDYTTPQAWEDACPANLVTNDEIWRGECQNQEFSSSSTILTIAGQTTDATRYVVLTTVSGASFIDHADKLTNALRYNASNGAAMTTSVTYAHGVVVSTSYTRISKLQIRATGNTSYGAISLGSNCLIEQTIIDGQTGAASLNSNSKAINCLAISRSTDANVAGFATPNFGTGVECYNCTAIKPSDIGTYGRAFQTSYGSMTIKNCAGLGFTSFYGVYGGSAGASGNNNASTTTISFGTSNQESLTYADQIEQPNATTGLDCRTKSGADLIDTGADLSASGVTTDIVGTARGATYDIGVWEYAAAGVTVTLTGVASTMSAGTVSPTLGMAPSGSAATSSAGTLTSALGSSVAGSAGTAADGTVGATLGASPSGSAATSAAGSVSGALGVTASGSAGTSSPGTVGPTIGMTVAGSALTMSAGLLAYTIGFILTGIASTVAGGTLATSGGDTEAARSLTGIQMRALPGNVRVTGGTPWSPSQPAAVVPPSMVGNTLQPPPRLTGNAEVDTRAIQQWLSTLYDKLIKEANALGRLADHEQRLAAIEADANDNST